MGTLTRMLADRAQARPDHLFLRFQSRGGEVETLTYSETWSWACRWAAALAERGVARGDKVVLALPNSADFLGAFFGTLLAGGEPAAQPPPRTSPMDGSISSALLRHIDFLDASALVISETIADETVRQPTKETGQQPVVCSLDLPDAAPHLAPTGREQDVALLQFTSGTVGPNKVVRLTHAALMAQVAAISEALSLDPERDSAVSWLPFFHDMGLIGFVLTPAFIGRHVTILRTEDFATRPGLWTRALSETGATITGGPPSAYTLCARRVRKADTEGLDLSRLRVALVGAETVTPASVDTFVDRFAPCGLRRSAMMPTYGLAENCLAVTIPPLARGPRFDTVDFDGLTDSGRAVQAPAGAERSRVFAAVGGPISGIEMAIVDDRDQPVTGRTVGEVVVRGPTVMAGYLHNPSATRDALRDGWLHTGDLGYLADGELHITGRRKEVLIIGGRNFYPEDLERVVATAPGVRAGRAVAISVHDKDTTTEAVVVLAETALTEPEGRDRLQRSIRQALTRAQLPIDRVVLLAPRTLEKTASGKLMRMSCKEHFLAGDFS